MISGRPLTASPYNRAGDCGVWSAHKIRGNWATMWLATFTTITVSFLLYLGFAFYKCLRKHSQSVQEGLMEPESFSQLRIRLVFYIICLCVSYLLPLCNKFVARIADETSTVHAVVSYTGTFMFHITGVVTFVLYSWNSDAWVAVKDTVCCRREEDEDSGSAVFIREQSITHEMMLSVLEYKDANSDKA